MSRIIKAVTGVAMPVHQGSALAAAHARHLHLNVASVLSLPCEGEGLTMCWGSSAARIGTAGSRGRGGRRRGRGWQLDGASMTVPQLAVSPSILSPRRSAEHMRRMSSSGSWLSAAA